MKYSLSSIQSSLRIALLGFLLVMNLTSLSAANRYWTGDAFEDRWSDQDNWAPKGVPQETDVLVFGNGASTRSSNNDLVNARVQSIVFESDGFSLRGNPILLNSDITTSHLGGYNNVRFGVQFTHGGGSFSVVRGGRLEISGNVTLANRQTLYVLALGNSLTISGALVGDGELNKSGVHPLFLNGTIANTYAGPTTIMSGAVYLNKSSGAQAISRSVFLGVGALVNCHLGDLTGGQYPVGMSVVVGPRGTWGLTNGATVSSLYLDNGHITGEGLLTLQCNITNRGLATIDCSLYLGNETRTLFTEYVEGNVSQLVVNGHILGPSGGANPPGIIKDGPGYVRLRNQNTYSGATTIEDGELFVEHNQALGTATGPTRLKPFGDLVFNGNVPLTLAEPIIAEGGNVYFQCNATLNGPFTLNHGVGFSGWSDKRLEIAGQMTGEQGFTVWGGTLRLSGGAPNTFAGDVMVWPADESTATLEFAKPNDVPCVPTRLELRGFETRSAVLRNFQDNGARDISLHDRATWDLNGFAATPTSLKFFGDSTVDTGMKGGFPGILNFTGSGVNTQLQVIARGFAPSNYTARIQGRVDLYSATNDWFVPGGVMLDVRAEIRGLAVQKRGPGKLVLARDNRFLGKIFVQDGELVSAHDRALGGHTTIANGATLWLDSVFNFGSLTIGGNGFQGQGALAASQVAIFSSNVVLSAPTMINTASTNGNLHIQGPISGTGPLTKEGTGFLTFEGNSASTFTGEMRVNAGMFVPAKSDFAPAVPGDLIVGSGRPGEPGATVLYGAHDQVWNRITVNRGSLLNLNNRDEYSGDVTLNEGGDIQTGTGTLYLGSGVNLIVNPSSAGGSYVSGRMALGPGLHRFYVGADPAGGGFGLDLPCTIADMSPAAGIVKEGSGSMGLRADNAFTGSLNINDGLVSATAAFAFGSAAAGTFVNSNASLALSGNFWVQNEPLTLNSSNPTALTSYGPSNTWSGNITLQRTASVYVRSANSVLNLMGFFDCCGGIISGPGGIVKSGDGRLMISGFGANSYQGSTIVNEGTLEAWRIVNPALPGDVFVSGPSSVLRTGRSPANSALSSSASVTLSNGALWAFNFANNETIRSLSGNGVLDLGGFAFGAALTVANTNFCEFSGVIVGTGALNKRGPAQLLLTGPSPIYGGASTVFEGVLRVDGRLPSSPVTIKNGAQLRGDGNVGNVTNETGGILQIDASFLDHPERQTGDMEASYLTFNAGSVVGFDLAGPSATGGNDLLIAHGPVSLGNARLSAEVLYPPRDGDVITLLRKNSIGPINGIFEGWPEGVTRKLGDVTVRATYLGGDGNDFTLTVTNLPVRYAGGPIFSGNGNETVESDECLLTHVFLQSRRSTTLTVTNAFLRSLTPEVTVTVTENSYPPIPAGGVRFNTTPFQFRTSPRFVCGTPIAFELVVGIRDEGTFAIPFNVRGSTNCNTAGGGTCESCFAVHGEFTTNSPTLVRSPLFIGAPSICFPPKRCPETNYVDGGLAIPYLTHVFTNSTTNELCLTAQLRFGISGVPTNALGAVAYLGTNDYHDPCVNYLGDTGVDGTQPFSFRVPPGTNFQVLVSARSTNVVCPSYTLELFGLPCPPPRLQIAKDASPEKVLLQWSTASPGFTLQTTNSCANGVSAFGNVAGDPAIVNGRYTVTNDSAGSQKVYRLKK